MNSRLCEKIVLFRDEKKFNLDNSGELQYHLNDLQKEAEVSFSKRFGEGCSVMVWGCISYKQTVDLLRVEGNMD